MKAKNSSPHPVDLSAVDTFDILWEIREELSDDSLDKAVAIETLEGMKDFLKAQRIEISSSIAELLS